MYLTGWGSCWQFNAGTSYALSYFESVYSMPNNGGMLDFNSSLDKNNLEQMKIGNANDKGNGNNHD